MDPKAQLDLLMAGTDYGDADLAKAMRRELGERLAEGRPLTVYLGVDPTHPNIHVGHGVVLEKLATFQRLGHRVIFVIGDFTAQIGDPTGRSKTRPPLTPPEVAANAATYADQAFRVLDRPKTELVYNSQWLSTLSLRDVIGITREFTLAQLLTREDFGKRHSEGAPIHLHEFLYALMQGQDAAHLKTDVQLGGSDQLFNILTGRDVMRHQGLRPQIPVIMPLLPGLDGKVKMSKSMGNEVGIAIEPADMYGKVMSLPDEGMPTWWRLIAGLDPADAEARVAGLADGSLHPRDAKMELARRITARWHGDAAALSAEAAFVSQFQKGAVPADCPVLEVAAGADAVDLVLLAGAAKSRAEAKRLIDQGGLSLDGIRVEGWGPVTGLKDGAVLKAGKRHLHRLKLGPKGT